eukprot:4122446-Pyramimonas_sp.AAC.1
MCGMIPRTWLMSPKTRHLAVCRLCRITPRLPLMAMSWLSALSATCLIGQLGTMYDDGSTTVVPHHL